MKGTWLCAGIFALCVSVAVLAWAMRHRTLLRSSQLAPSTRTQPSPQNAPHIVSVVGVPGSSPSPPAASQSIDNQDQDSSHLMSELQGNSATASRRLNLPQSQEKVVLPGAAWKALETALAENTGSGSFVLASESAAQLMESLPKSFRDSCSEVVGTWGAGARKTALWTVRVLFSVRNLGASEVLLALRCGSTAAAVKAVYDERPAIVSLAPDSATLRLIPLAKDCGNCSSLYRVEFSQTFTAVGARLLELLVGDSNDSPCCDGGDQKSEDRRVILRLPDGDQVLAVDEATEEFSGDDSVEDGDSDTACKTKIDYSRDGAGNVESIRTETRCTENKKPQPEVYRQSFQWNAGARRFDQLKESSR